MYVEKPEVSVIVPAHDEAQRIREPLREIGAYLGARSYQAEIIVVDDGSTDSTLEVVRKVARNLDVPVRVFGYEKNRGKGYALKVGFEKARGERILFTDADLSTPIREAAHFLEALNQGYPVVIGSRKTIGSDIRKHQPWYREKMGKVFTLLVHWWIADVSDVTCGFKAFQREIGQDLFKRSRIADWSFDAEILWIAFQRGFEVREIPVEWADRCGSKVSLLRDTMRSLAGLARIRLNAALGRYDDFIACDPALLLWENKPPHEKT